MLPTSYFHALRCPARTEHIALENPCAFYHLLFAASTASRLKMATDPKRIPNFLFLAHYSHSAFTRYEHNREAVWLTGAV